MTAVAPSTVSNSAALRMPNVSRAWSSSARTPSRLRSTPAESEASTFASAPRRAACAARAALRSTIVATTAPTPTNTAMANAFSGSAIVKVPTGGTKKKFANRLASSAVTMAGASPPTSAVATTPSRKASSTVLRLSASRTGRSTRVSRRGRASPTAQAHTLRGPWIRRPVSRRCGSSGWVPRVTTWTSISPESRTMSPAVLGRSAVLSRPRRDVPTTTCVPFTDRAKSSTAVAMSSPTTVWKVPPRSSVSWRSAARVSGLAPRVPSPRTTWTAVRARPAERPAMSAPRRSSASSLALPVSATTMRARAAHVCWIPCCSR